MAKQQLPTNFKDDVLAAQMVGKRRYRVIQNEDGTISLEDVTNYSQIGSNFGAAQTNATNLAVNESFDKNKVIDSLADIVANEATGYAAGALAVRELNGKSIVETGSNANGNYIKYADGTLEMWGKKSAEYICKTTAGSGYVSTGIPITFPIASKTECVVTVQKIAASIEATCGGICGVSTKTGVTAFVLSLFQISNARIAYFHWRATGTWK